MTVEDLEFSLLQFPEGALLRMHCLEGDKRTLVDGKITMRKGAMMAVEKADGSKAIINASIVEMIESLPISEDEKTQAQPSEAISPSELSGEKEPSSPVVEMRSYVTLPDSTPSFRVKDAVSILRGKVRETGESFRREINGIISSFEAAVKSHDVVYKGHDLTARSLKLWNNCYSSVEFEAFYMMLGLIKLSAEHYDEAQEPLIRAHCYQLAAYAAMKAEDSNRQLDYESCALLAGEGEILTRQMADGLIARKDAKFLSELVKHLEEAINPTAVTDLAEQTASCAFEMCKNAGVDVKVDEGSSPITAARRLIEGLQKDETKSRILSAWQEYSSYKYPQVARPSKEEERDVYLGKIKMYNPQDCYGFIIPDPGQSIEEVKGNLYFYYAQVMADTEDNLLLRRALSVPEVAIGCSVSFELGESITRVGTLAASAIRLTQAGRDELETSLNGQERKSGYIEFYSQDMNWGKIHSKSGLTTFNIHNVSDPWLAAYLQNSNDDVDSQDVTFIVQGNHAEDVVLKNQDERLRETWDSNVTKTQRSQWDLRIEREKQRLSKSLLPDTDPYANLVYRALEDRRKEDPSMLRGRPLTWSSGGTKQTTPAKMVLTSNPTIDKQFVKVSNTIPDVVIRSRNIEHARQATIEGDLKEAEGCFRKEINSWGPGDFDEAVLGDYVTLLIRMDDKLDEALQLINRYSSRMTHEKVQNLRIAVLDKRKDYGALVPIYKEMTQKATTLTKKRHNILRLMQALVSSGDYRQVLEVSHQWDNLVKQNRFNSAVADSLQSAQPLVNRQKAIAYYYLGDTEKSRDLAMELVHANPSDLVAMGILNGTLGKDSEDAKTLEMDDDYGLFDEEEPEQEDIWDEELMPEVVHDKIMHTDIASLQKFEYLKDNEYTGTKEQAKKDVESLLKIQRTTPERRSQALFAACRLIEMMHLEIRNKYYEVRLAGRAMAAWGDSQVRVLLQQDTTRMAYLYAMKVLIPTKRGTEQAWTDSYNRYVRSFVVAPKSGEDSLSSYIQKQNSTHAKDSANLNVLRSHNIVEYLIPEFVNGMVMLAETLKNQNDKKRIFLEDLYSVNSDLRRSILRQAGRILNRSIDEGMSRNAFCNLIGEELTKRFADKKEKLAIAITNATKLVFNPQMEAQVIETLNDESWKTYLTRTDSTRLTAIYGALEHYRSYYSNSDFDSRKDCLTATIANLNEILHSIVSEPTDFSYAVYKPALEDLLHRLQEEEDGLYQQFRPKLAIEEMIPPYRTPGGTIAVRLRIRNEERSQTAESLRIHSIHGKNVIKVVDCGTTIETLRGGASDEESIEVKISEEDNRLGSFDAKISFECRYHTDPTHVTTMNETKDFTFIIPSENFVELQNPFIQYVGTIMKNERMFYGRGPLIERIVKTAMPEGRDGVLNWSRGIAIYGQTRAGKSSILYRLEDKFKKEYNDRLLCVSFTLGEVIMDDADHYLQYFFSRILNGIQRGLRGNQEFAKIAEENGVSTRIGDILSMNATQAMTYFVSYMQCVDEEMKQSNRMVVLLLDEFTYIHTRIKDGTIPRDFMQYWKALLQEHRIFAIIAAQDDMKEFMDEFPNEFACMELQPITFLDEVDAQKLVHQPLEEANGRADGSMFTQESLHAIYELTAGSAYLTILLCSHLVEYMNLKGVCYVTQGVVNEFMNTVVLGSNTFLSMPNFEPQYRERGHNELDEANLSILLSVARLTQKAGSANRMEIKCKGKNQQETDALIDRLVDRKVLVVTPKSRDHYVIQVKLLEKWLIMNYGL